MRQLQLPQDQVRQKWKFPGEACTACSKSSTQSTTRQLTSKTRARLMSDEAWKYPTTSPNMPKGFLLPFTNALCQTLLPESWCTCSPSRHWWRMELAKSVALGLQWAIRIKPYRLLCHRLLAKPSFPRSPTAPPPLSHFRIPDRSTAMYSMHQWNGTHQMMMSGGNRELFVISDG